MASKKKKKSTAKKGSGTKTKKTGKHVKLTTSSVKPKHRDANRGEDVFFDNGSTKALHIHFDSSPFLASLGPQDFSVPAKNSVSKKVSSSAVPMIHYPYNPSFKTAKKKGAGARKSDGPPGPPDVVVSG